jgi:hypothetical protein
MVRLKAAYFITNRRAAMSFIDFADVKARCSIAQAAKLVGLQTTPKNADSVAKVPKCLATNLSQKDETTDDRRSMCPQARYRSCL